VEVSDCIKNGRRVEATAGNNVINGVSSEWYGIKPLFGPNG